MSDEQSEIPPPSASSSVPFVFDDQSPEKKRYDFRFTLPAPTAPSPQPMDVDTSGPIRLPAEVTEEMPVVTSQKKQKLNNGKVKPKIRKLASVDGDDTEPVKAIYFGVRSLVLVSLVFSILAMLAVFVKDELRKDFYIKYKRQYNLLLYGKEDYCSQELDLTNVTAALENRMVGQSAAIAQMVEFFDRNRYSHFSSAILIGPVGVGKSLMADLIANNFQWRSNVHRYHWSNELTVQKQASKFQTFLHSLRHGTSAADLKCGYNLLIIDQLVLKDMELVNKIDNRLRLVAEKDDIQLTALYLFQGSFVADVQVVEQLNASIERVVLQSLTGDDLKRCIRQEAEELGISLNENQQLLEQVIGSVDVHRYGCKGVRAKLSLYSQPQSVENDEL